MRLENVSDARIAALQSLRRCRRPRGRRLSRNLPTFRFGQMRALKLISCSPGPRGVKGAGRPGGTSGALAHPLNGRSASILMSWTMTAAAIRKSHRVSHA